MTTDKMSSMNPSDVAEALLGERLEAFDVYSDDVAMAESPRAYAFRAMRENWNRWDEEDVRWQAVWELLDPCSSDGGFTARGQFAAAEMIDVIGCVRPGCMPTYEALKRMDANVALLASIAAEIRCDVHREYRGASVRWPEWEAAHPIGTEER